MNSFKMHQGIWLLLFTIQKFSAVGFSTQVAKMNVNKTNKLLSVMNCPVLYLQYRNHTSFSSLIKLSEVFSPLTITPIYLSTNKLGIYSNRILTL